jgi:hypothetical protein
MNEITNNNEQIWECGEYRENSGAVIATLKNHTLTISGQGRMKGNRNGYYTDDTARYCPWANANQSITKVIIKDGVKNIPNEAFLNQTGIKIVVLADSVSEIGGGAFRNCTGLKKFIVHRLSPIVIDGLNLFDDKQNSFKTVWSKRYVYKGQFLKASIDEYEKIPDNLRGLAAKYGWSWNKNNGGYEADWIYDNVSKNYVPLGKWGEIDMDETYENKEEYTTIKIVRTPAKLYVPADSIQEYRNVSIWYDRFSDILPITEVEELDGSAYNETDEQSIDAEIAILEKKLDALRLSKNIFRGVKGNPKHVAEFMSLFNQRDGLKYLTHDFDESGDFDYEEFLAQIKNVCAEHFDKLELPKTLIGLLQQFAFENKPKWTALDRDFNDKKMTSGWSAETGNNNLHPIKLQPFAETIRDFKRTTRIESPNLESLINKVFADVKPETKDLRKADFYTHVGEFKVALETILEEIRQRSDTDDKKKVSVEYKRETCDDYFAYKIFITHHNSFPTRGDEDALIKEWLSFKGNMGKIGEHLQGYCHWSVITKINDKPVKVNILREKDTPTQEDIDDSAVLGFTHILTFYYQ